MLKHLPTESLQLLLHLFNDIWNGSPFPALWQQATVIPLPKAVKNSGDPNSYRPISLTSYLCKTIERIINNRLVYFLEKNNIITSYQSGFRSNRSTVDQLVHLETCINQSINQKSLTPVSEPNGTISGAFQSQAASRCPHSDIQNW